jgi:ABC-type branched-subunit amino acid transport system substrate-binding protein
MRILLYILFILLSSGFAIAQDSKESKNSSNRLKVVVVGEKFDRVIVKTGKVALAGEKLDLVIVKTEDEVTVESSKDITNIFCKTPATKESSLANSLLIGAKLALLCSDRPEIKSLREIIKIESENDGRDECKARAIALRLAKDPSVLAVIGHDSSATTQAAVGIYEQSGIPVLTPTSSPLVMKPDYGLELKSISNLCKNKEKKIENEEFWLMAWIGNINKYILSLLQDKKPKTSKNVFRLAPSDLGAQAPAIALFTTSQFKDKNIGVVIDKSPLASVYSEPLCTQIIKLLESHEIEDDLQNIQKENQTKKVRKSKLKTGDSDFKFPPGFEPDAIIYCGYPAAANQMITQLKKIYECPKNGSKCNKTTPQIVFSDGIVGQNFEPPTQFRSFLAYPFPGLNTKRKIESKDLKFLKNYLNKKEEAFEVIGYDAIKIIANAVNECKNNDERKVSRKCLIEKIDDKIISGTIETYGFEAGENKLSSYYIYDLSKFQKPKNGEDFQGYEKFYSEKDLNIELEKLNVPQ